MAHKTTRLVLSAVLAIGLMTMFAMPAAAQEVPEPDPEEGIEASGELDATNQAGSLLAQVFGVTVLEIDCEFDQDNPTESCEFTVLDNTVPPEDGGPGLPGPGLPLP